jgi:hypothetical protein
MDKSFHPQRSDRRRLSTFFTAFLKIFDSALYWLIGFIQLTEEEKRDAGIYHEYPGDK